MKLFRRKPKQKQPKKSQDVVVLRTDFSSDETWVELWEAIKKPYRVEGYEFQAYVQCISDKAYDGVSIEEILSNSLTISDHGFIFVADKVTFLHQDHPILVVDLLDEPGRTFRVIASEMWSVENNLSIANMDFSQFTDHVDEEGIHRGFLRI